MTTYVYDATVWHISSLSGSITGSSRGEVRVTTNDAQTSFDYSVLSSSDFSSVVRLDSTGIYSVLLDGESWSQGAEITQFNWSRGLSGSTTALGLSIRDEDPSQINSYLVSLNGPDVPLLSTSNQLLNFISGQNSVGNATDAPRGYRAGDAIEFSDIPGARLTQDDYFGLSVNSLGEVFAGIGNDTVEFDESLFQIDGGEGTDVVRIQSSIGTFEVNRLQSGIEITTEVGITEIRNVEQFDVVGESYTFNEFLAATAAEGITIVGEAGNESYVGGTGADRLDGGAGADTLDGGDGADTIVGGEGDDVIVGGTSIFDLRDRVFAGDGNDRVEGGYGNDELRGGGGNDTLLGGFGADTVIGGDDNDVVAGQALSDLMFGGAGDDYLNGGFGSDRLNGGEGADQFFHLGVADHGSDWIQDFGPDDVLIFGGTAELSQFQVNVATTAGAGSAEVDEAFVIYRPTGQILWALVDGADQEAVTLRLGGADLDLML